MTYKSKLTGNIIQEKLPTNERDLLFHIKVGDLMFCELCPAVIIKTTHNKKYCDNCQKLKVKEWDAKKFQNIRLNKPNQYQRLQTKTKEWSKENRIKENEKYKRYYSQNSEKRKQYRKERYKITGK